MDPELCPSPAPKSPLVRGEQQLAGFRAHWGGARLLDLVAAEGGQVLIGWPVGAGKSTALDAMLAEAIGADRYDLVVALLPTRRVLEERAWVRNPPAGVDLVNVRPRPRQRCGGLDQPWRHFETAGMGALGRARLCAACPRRQGCFWPDQYGAGLKGAKVIFATHAHLGRAPDFVAQLAARVGASRVLTLLDEVGFAATGFRRRIGRRDLERFAGVLDALSSATATATPAVGPGTVATATAAAIDTTQAWARTVRLLLAAPTVDLRSFDWWTPRTGPDVALAVQAAGWAAHGAGFKYLGSELEQLVRSPLGSRERHRNGDLSFAVPPVIGGDFAIFSGTAHPEFLRFRLGRRVSAPFSGYRFEHPGTRWYNIASRLGMRAHFARNADQILEFFAGLVSLRLSEGRRPLLIAKKCFVDLCARLLGRALARIHPRPVRIVTGDWDSAAVDLAAPDVVPLIHFGLIGTNLFERFDSAFALTGFYVNAEIVDAILQDVLASDGQIPIAIETAGHPRRRRARVANPRDRYYDIDRLAQLALDQQELDTVLQAVGRVRPYTRPREVITFQCAALPDRPYDREFASLEEARRFFGVPSRRRRARDDNHRRVQEARRAGLTQRAAAARLGLGLATVKRHWNA